MKIILCIISLFLVFSVSAQVVESSDQVPVDFKARAFNEQDFNTFAWLKEFTYVIVINKSNSGSDKQTLRVYQNSKLKEFTRISSGRETFEKGCGPGQQPKLDHCSNRAYWSTTPVGYFDLDVLEENYFSILWETWMPYAVFFTDGIAMHQAPAGKEGKIGNRASGGCVRMHPSMAPKIFAMIKSAGKGLIPVVDRDGNLKKNSFGDVVRTQGYKTLVIAQNVVK